MQIQYQWTRQTSCATFARTPAAACNRTLPETPERWPLLLRLCVRRAAHSHSLLASRRFLARVMWISPEGSVRAYVWSFFQFVVNLLKFNFSDPCIIMIYTDKMFPEDFENHPTYYARRYVQAQPQEPPRSRVRSLKPLSNQVSFHYLICRGSTVNHIRTIGTF